MKREKEQEKWGQRWPREKMKKEKEQKYEDKNVPRESAAAPQSGAQGKELRSTASAPVTQRTTTIGLIFLFRLLFVFFKFYKQGKSDT